MDCPECARLREDNKVLMRALRDACEELVQHEAAAREALRLLDEHPG
jgi:hypothetical protein